MLKVILKFGIVGVINTLLDYSILQLLVFAFDIKGGIFLLLANTCSSSVAVINSFLLNKKWTFQDKEERYIRQFFIFALVNVFSIAVNDSAILLLNHLTPTYLHVLHYSIRSILITKVGAILFTMVFNFIAYRVFVFKVETQYN